jgi:hypothetical protein
MNAAKDELRRRREARVEKLKRQKKKLSSHWPHAELTNAELIIVANECGEVSGHTEEEIQFVLKELERRVRDLNKERQRLKELLETARPQEFASPPRPMRAIEGGKK